MIAIPRQSEPDNRQELGAYLPVSRGSKSRQPFLRSCLCNVSNSERQAEVCLIFNAICAIWADPSAGETQGTTLEKGNRERCSDEENQLSTPSVTSCSVLVPNKGPNTFYSPPRSTRELLLTSRGGSRAMAWLVGNDAKPPISAAARAAPHARKSSYFADTTTPLESLPKS